MDNNNIETDESAENINELDLLNDRFLRKCAEFENYKRRVQKDKEELVLNTKNKILSAILDMDNDVSLALKSMDEVIQVVSKGYMLNGKLLRHPKIIIGK